MEEKEVRTMRGERDFLWIAFMAWSIIFLFLFPLQVLSQDFPTGPILVYAGFEAGANTDLSARALVEEAQKELGVPVVVENKAGGGGSVVATLLAKKKPDGYTLAVITTSALDTRHIVLSPAYNPFKDFTYILSYGTGVGGLFVKRDSPFRNLQDLIEQARLNPGMISYSTPGPGGGQHLSAEFLAKQAKVKFKHVPFKGDAPSATAIMGGHVDFASGGGLQMNYVIQGIFRMLAVTLSEERVPEIPDTPTLKELGYKNVPPYSYALLAPKGLPDPVYKRLDAAFRKAAHSSEFQKKLKTFKIPFVFKDRRQLEAEFPVRYQFYADFLDELGLTKK